MAKKRMLILIDYRGYFYSTTEKNQYSLNLDRLQREFEELNYELEIRGFPDIDFTEKLNFDFAVYQSSEDAGLFYKDYIEDILLGLTLSGVVIIPGYDLFRAHHNKVFMEILRDISEMDKIKNLKSSYFGTYQDFKRKSDDFAGMFVVKTAAGTGSRAVRLAANNMKLDKTVKQISRSFNLRSCIKEKIKSLIRPDYAPVSGNRRKFIIQKFIPGLNYDYKVLVYSGKYYVLKRYNRKNDFRASGSGLFEWPADPDPALLNFAKEIFQSFKTPFVSLDIAFDGKHYYLIEFQFLMFGPYTIEKSNYHFVNHDGAWEKVDSASVLEVEFARSIDDFIRNHYQ
jgi:hypothetical protein